MDAAETRDGVEGKIDGAKEKDRHVREESAGVSQCQIVDCSICLHDFELAASWVCLLARDEMFGAQSSCQAQSYTPTPRVLFFF